MENTNTSVIILAAGKGKRMNNPDSPKVLAEINDKPLIFYVLSQVVNLTDNKIILVVGHKSELVIDYIGKSDFQNIEFAFQNEQLGTGHAVQQAESLLSEFDGDVLILAGDVPLLKSESLKKFINIHKEVKSDVSVLSTTAPDPSGYGRIVRDSDNNFLKIVEHKDANEDIKKIDEINSGIYIVNSKLIFNSLSKVSNKNSQGEYYLTDIIEVLKNEDKKVFAINAAPFVELQGINTVDELKRASEMYNLLK
jgi:UDP-N-acetylglucosamine diphosphorylase/glucosamine-1-phosphate N-acetyltransferase